MRTGSEPSTARSPLRMRLWLSLWGMIWAVLGLAAFVATGRAGWAAACAVLLAVTVTDFCVVVRRMRQGPHYQPGRDVPPYEPDRRGQGPDVPPSEPDRRGQGSDVPPSEPGPGRSGR